MSNPRDLFLPFAAAFVRGTQLAGTNVGLPRALLEPSLSELHQTQLESIASAGFKAGLRLHRFKRTMGLRRVERVIGILRSFEPTSLLDIGTGRGAFLWPLMDAMPQLPVTAGELLQHRLRDLQAVHRGGIGRLAVTGLTATAMPFADRSFDGVTFLETLEHIPCAQSALTEAVRVARRFVVVSVPSKPDGNPEHIHLFNETILREMCLAAGAASINFQWVLNHLIAVIAARDV